MSNETNQSGDWKYWLDPRYPGTIWRTGPRNEANDITIRGPWIEQPLNEPLLRASGCTIDPRPRDQNGRLLPPQQNTTPTAPGGAPTSAAPATETVADADGSQEDGVAGTEPAGASAPTSGGMEGKRLENALCVPADVIAMAPTGVNATSQAMSAAQFAENEADAARYWPAPAIIPPEIRARMDADRATAERALTVSRGPTLLELTGPVSHEEAREIARRFIDGHFKNPGREYARVRIPADWTWDDDLRLCAYIEQQKALAARLAKLEAIVAKLPTTDDGAPIVPGMTVWVKSVPVECGTVTAIDKTGVYVGRPRSTIWHKSGSGQGGVYSTEAAVRAAIARKGEEA